MKKILFCLQTMILGGVEKELITIMKRMPPEEFEVTLLLLYVSDAEIMKQIPPYIRVIDLNIDKDYYCASCASLCRQRVAKGKFLQAGALALKRALKIGMTHANTDLSGIPNCEEFYDVAVCYHIHSPLALRYVAEKTKATKKIAWIHNDFSTTGFPVHKLQQYLDQYQEFVAVSDMVKNEFVQLCPKYKDRVFMHHNIIDEDEIIEKSNEPISDQEFLRDDIPRLLTMGRFAKQKGFDFAIKAAQLLKQEKIDFKWFFIGAGEKEQEYRRLITECNVQDRVFILGRKNNPYPYLKNCDIYIQPSRHEAYALVIMEAKVLHKPIICNCFAGAEEQIANGKNGKIVSVGNIEELATAIKDLLFDFQTRNNFTEMLKKELAEANDWADIKAHFVDA